MSSCSSCSCSAAAGAARALLRPKLAAGAAATGAALFFAAPAGALPRAPASQHFSQFGACPEAPAGSLVPTGSGCVTVRHADVDGDGRTDLIVLYATLGPHREARSFTLELVRSSGKTTKLGLGRSDMNVSVASLTNVNARPGVELFLHEGHVTTEEEMGVYTFNGQRLVRAGRLPFNGSDAGIRFGFTCVTGAEPTIVEHAFQEATPFRGNWQRTDTTYAWAGARLVRGASETVAAAPAPAGVGPHF